MVSFAFTSEQEDFRSALADFTRRELLPHYVLRSSILQHPGGSTIGGSMTGRGGAEPVSDTSVDPVEWTRERWAEEGQAAPEHFAAMAALMRAHQQMTAVLDDVLKAHDLTRTGFLLLSTLRIARAHSRPLGRLGRQMMVHPTTVTLVIDQLEKRGLVLRTRHASDRRTILAQLTPEGEAAVTRAAADLAEHGFGLGGIDTGQAERLVAELGSVRRAQGDLDPPGAGPVD